MLISTAPPAKTPESMRTYYRNIHAEGLAFSARMTPTRYEMSADFDPEWAVDSLSWIAGGEERYSFADGRRISLRSGGVLASSRGERYDYEAVAASPFRSNMIVFSDELARRVAASVSPEVFLSENTAPRRPALETALIRPGLRAAGLMRAIEQACRNGDADGDWIEERATLLYVELLGEQKRLQDAAACLGAAKRSTRTELQRRAGLAAHYMHERYADASLTLAAIACEARLSRFHFVRVFRALYGKTPVQYLTGIRIDAAARLLAETESPVCEIATQTGFSERTAFFRRFQQHYGVSPSEYRRGA